MLQERSTTAQDLQPRSRETQTMDLDLCWLKNNLDEFLNYLEQQQIPYKLIMNDETRNATITFFLPYIVTFSAYYTLPHDVEAMSISMLISASTPLKTQLDSFHDSNIRHVIYAVGSNNMIRLIVFAEVAGGQLNNHC